jgi:hypothetical protein
MMLLILQPVDILFILVDAVHCNTGKHVDLHNDCELIDILDETIWFKLLLGPSVFKLQLIQSTPNIILTFLALMVFSQ